MDFSNIQSFYVQILKIFFRQLNDAPFWAGHSSYKEYCDENGVITEGFSINTLKLAVQNFKGKVKDLSTKEKAMWQSLDATMSGFMKAIEKSLTSDRREAIIKGSIIPSFSKCIKTALVVAGVGLNDAPFLAGHSSLSNYDGYSKGK